MTALARRPPDATALRAPVDRGPLTEYLGFVLAGQTYAVPIGQVQEILRPPPVTEVPRAPRDIVGVVSVRGRLVTLFDLRRRLRLADAAPTTRARVLLAEAAEGEAVGLLVDEVLQVYRLADADIEAAAGVLGSDLPDYVVGIGRHEGTVAILLDLRPMFAEAAS